MCLYNLSLHLPNPSLNCQGVFNAPDILRNVWQHSKAKSKVKRKILEWRVKRLMRRQIRKCIEAAYLQYSPFLYQRMSAEPRYKPDHQGAVKDASRMGLPAWRCIFASGTSGWMIRCVLFEEVIICWQRRRSKKEETEAMQTRVSRETE